MFLLKKAINLATSYVVGVAAEFTAQTFFELYNFAKDWRMSVKQGHPGYIEVDPENAKPEYPTVKVERNE